MKIRAFQSKKASENLRTSGFSGPSATHAEGDPCCFPSTPTQPLQAKARRAYGNAGRSWEPAETVAKERRIDFSNRSGIAEAPDSEVQRPPLQASMAGHAPVPATAARSSSGIPLQLRAAMEGAFQTDLSDVRIHASSNKASRIGALAYTRGSDIHFAPGLYRPHTRQGRELLGHELTHVVQQRQGRVRPTGRVGGLPVNENPRLEAEADALGAKAAAFSTRPVTGASPSATGSGSQIVQGQWWLRLLQSGSRTGKQLWKGSGQQISTQENILNRIFPQLNFQEEIPKEDPFGWLRDLIHKNPGLAMPDFQGNESPILALLDPFNRKDLSPRIRLEEALKFNKENKKIPYYEIREYYRLAQEMAKEEEKDPGFFEIAEDVTGPSSLGALDYLPGISSILGGPFVLKQTMPELSKELFDFNLNLILSNKAVAPEDIVFEEQTRVQKFIDDMSETDPGKTFTMLKYMNRASTISSLIGGFGGGMTKEALATEGIRKFSGIEDSELDLLRQNDRMAIGLAALALKKDLTEEERLDFIVGELKKSQKKLTQ